MAGKKGKSGRKPGFHNPNAGRKPFPADEKKVTISVILRRSTVSRLAVEGYAAGITGNQHAARILERRKSMIDIDKCESIIESLREDLSELSEKTDVKNETFMLLSLLTSVLLDEIARETA